MLDCVAFLGSDSLYQLHMEFMNRLFPEVTLSTEQTSSAGRKRTATIAFQKRIITTGAIRVIALGFMHSANKKSKVYTDLQHCKALYHPGYVNFASCLIEIFYKNNVHIDY